MPAGDGNLFADLARMAPAPAERIEALWTAPGLRLERIVSTGQASPPGFWYDQPWAEWVLLLTGSAGLRFADEPEPRSLRPGDHLLIPPHRRHRVEWTAPGEPSVWLALHLAPSQDEGG
jgi:cupin 2 domain-containing protein